MAALIATHNPDLAARMDRTVTLKDGIYRLDRWERGLQSRVTEPERHWSRAQQTTR